ncbi:MAG: GAF domain-containing protein [Kofleriaceae bacterium]|nr:GAF domain-containing protein [Kofleriaceae bacterium]
MASVVEQRHLVQFYEDARFLSERVATFLKEALATGGAAGAIARPEHLAAICVQLERAGVDIEKVRGQGRLLLADAQMMLDTFMAEQSPNPARFVEAIGTRIRSLQRRAQHHAVHVYGEMVDLLWESGNRDGVGELEDLWTSLMHESTFRLLCGYRISAFDRDTTGFDFVCTHHDAARPTTNYAVLGGGGIQAHALALVEQRARALESEVLQRRRLEGRMHELLDVGGELAAARNRQTVAQLLVENGRRAVGAETARVWSLAPGAAELQLLAVSQSVNHPCEPDTLPLDGDSPIAHVARTGEALYIGNADEYRERYPASHELDPGHIAVAILPIVADSAIRGVLAYSYAHPRSFERIDRAFKTILARQCALALERLHLQEQDRALREAAERAASAEKQARSDVELLYELTATVARLDSVEAVYDLALQTVLRGSRADRAAILLFEPDGVLRFKASHGLSDAYRRAAEGYTPWDREEPYPAPISVGDVEADPGWASSRDVVLAEGIRALAFVPLVHRRELIGKFALYRDSPTPFAARDLQLAATVAVHVATAVERKRDARELARSLREEREARVLAEDARRARQDILSIVTHDLRNPLGTVMMGAQSLLSFDTEPERIRKIAERIQRQADRMARLITDLVDYGGIETGKLALERASHRPDAIIEATTDIFAQLAEERGLRFESRIWPDLPLVDCDSERAVQVLGNLVSNALKVTPRGGAVSIGAEPKDRDVVFYVRDTGPGIDAEDLPLLFERHWQSETSAYRHARLGLSIARGIVDAHGGRIWAESQVGAGSTFYFHLGG